MGPGAPLRCGRDMAAGLLAAWLAINPTFASAQTVPPAKKAAIESDFAAWLAATVRPAALKAGVSQKTFEAATKDVALDWSLPDLAPPGTPPLNAPQRQPEFSDPARYVREQNFAGLIPDGRARLKRLSKTLDTVEKRFGVPPEIVVAIWARESRYGQAAVTNVAVRALATEAFMGARKEKFFPELIAALKILEGDHIPLAEMKSSWAGAMGQPQFLPSKYLDNAVDMDGDGRRDIWRSEPDVLGSIGNYLKKHGWIAGRPWGVEVSLPADVACTFEGPDQGKTVAEWVRLGARPLGQAKLPADAGRKVFLLMPAGRSGPAFLVSENFYVIKEYNESDLYALFVGHLADRYGAGSPIAGAWTAPKGFDRADVAAMQRRLEGHGHDVGGADGLVGFRTRVAIGRWQAANGQAPTCFPDAALVKTVGR